MRFDRPLIQNLRFNLFAALLTALALTPFSSNLSAAQTASSVRAHCPVNAKDVLKIVEAAQATTDSKDDAMAMVCMAEVIVDQASQIEAIREGKTEIVIVPPAKRETHR